MLATNRTCHSHTVHQPADRLANKSSRANLHLFANSSEFNQLLCTQNLSLLYYKSLSAYQSIAQSINQPMNQSTNPSFHQSIDRSINQPNQWTNQTTRESNTPGPALLRGQHVEVGHEPHRGEISFPRRLRRQGSSRVGVPGVPLLA